MDNQASELQMKNGKFEMHGNDKVRSQNVVTEFGGSQIHVTIDFVTSVLWLDTHGRRSALRAALHEPKSQFF